MNIYLHAISCLFQLWLHHGSNAGVAMGYRLFSEMEVMLRNASFVQGGKAENGANGIASQKATEGKDRSDAEGNASESAIQGIAMGKQSNLYFQSDAQGMAMHEGDELSQEHKRGLCTGKKSGDGCACHDTVECRTW